MYLNASQEDYRARSYEKNGSYPMISVVRGLVLLLHRLLDPDWRHNTKLLSPPSHERLKWQPERDDSIHYLEWYLELLADWNWWARHRRKLRLRFAVACIGLQEWFFKSKFFVELLESCERHFCLCTMKHSSILFGRQNRLLNIHCRPCRTAMAHNMINAFGCSQSQADAIVLVRWAT